MRDTVNEPARSFKGGRGTEGCQTRYWWVSEKNWKETADKGKRIWSLDMNVERCGGSHY